MKRVLTIIVAFALSGSINAMEGPTKSVPETATNPEEIREAIDALTDFDNVQSVHFTQLGREIMVLWYNPFFNRPASYVHGYYYDPEEKKWILFFNDFVDGTYGLSAWMPYGTPYVVIYDVNGKQVSTINISKVPRTWKEKTSTTILTSDDIPISFEYKDNDYPITDEMIMNAYTINRNGHINDMMEPDPSVIFKDNESQQIIFINLHANLHRLYISHFYENEIPDELIQIYTSYAKLNDKDIDVKKRIKDLIKNATIIEKEYFTTKRNFRLGMNSKEAISIYGEPTKKIENNNVTKLIWNYDRLVYGKFPRGVKVGVDISEELFNKVGYGFILEITFRDDKANFIYMVNMFP